MTLLFWGHSLSVTPTLADSPYNNLDRYVPGTLRHTVKHKPNFHRSGYKDKSISQPISLGLLKQAPQDKDVTGSGFTIPRDTEFKVLLLWEATS